jgi:outer membrane immunogenic protein
MKKLAVAAAISLAAVTAASAADLPVYKKAPAPPPPVLTWAGFYLGLNAGGIWTNSGSASAVPGACSAALGGCTSVPNYSTLMAIAASSIAVGNKTTSFLGGGQVGYNWQTNNWVFGIEADFDGVSSSGSQAGTIVTPSPAFPAFPLTTTFTDQQRLNYLGTARVRMGVTVSPAFLVYATGGLAYGGINSSTTITQMIAAPDPSIPAFGTGGGSTTRTGFTVGGGAEWMSASHWSFKVEYLYYDLGTVSYAIPLAVVSTALPGAVTGSTVATISNRFNGSVVRAGVNWHF